LPPAFPFSVMALPAFAGALVVLDGLAETLALASDPVLTPLLVGEHAPKSATATRAEPTDFAFFSNVL